MTKKYYPHVWDLTFCLMDIDGNPKKDKEGNIILYEDYKMDCSSICDFVDENNLTQIKEKEKDNN
tara:strand:+ start:3500 stop:3694 length:195 start_codon:yes stop_codon:yes gene_type:complete